MIFGVKLVDGQGKINTGNNHMLDFNRIRYLLNPEHFAHKKITIVGAGSGGFPVCQHLTMNGIHKWDIYDPDLLDEVNLVKHPALRKDIGRPKAEILAEWIEDRNPISESKAYQEDVMWSESFIKSVRTSDLVLACPDKKNVREYISDICVSERKPFVTASVFRTGIGGEIFSYVPQKTGCFRCLQLFAILNNINLTDSELGLTEEEQSRIYGYGEEEYRASGLSIDIQTIALIQIRMALSILIDKKESTIPTLKSNWIIYGNRPAKGIFRKHFEVKQMLLRPQHSCNCLMNNDNE
jgi:molybdopterin/thiamine biosynthesis adenylyltransferase